MVVTKHQVASFRQIILTYAQEHGRHDLPWRTTYTSPYHILIAEIMLQQTGVDRVIPKFVSFVTTFPTIEVLAASPQSAVLQKWVGLGYNRRALYLHRAAQIIVAQHKGIVPDTTERLRTLPGIGPYAASSIAAFAYNRPEIVIDTNIRTVYIHHFFADRDDVSDTELTPYIEATLIHDSARKWYGALMDYGTYLKKSVGNITRRSKHFATQSPLRGSRRELRGAIIKLLKNGPLSQVELEKRIHILYPHNEHSPADVIIDLKREKLIVQKTGLLTYR